MLPRDRTEGGRVRADICLAVAAPIPSAAVPVAAPVAAPASSFITKRQLPALPQSQADGSVIVSMEWINYMADLQKNGGAVNVGAMMAQVSPGIISAQQPVASGPPSITGLLGTVKARRFRA